MSDSGRRVWFGLLDGEASRLPWCDHGLESNIRMTTESWLLFLFCLHTFLGWSVQAPILEWSEGWFPSCTFWLTSGSQSWCTSAPDPSSQHKTRVDLIEPLVVAGSLVLCGCSPAQKGENKYYQVDSYLYSSPHNTRKSQGAFPTFEVSKNIMKPRIFIAACVSSLISLCPKWRLNIIFVGY